MARKTTCDLCDREIRGRVYTRFEETMDLKGNLLEISIESGKKEDDPDICTECHQVLSRKIEEAMKEGLEEIEAHF